MVQFGLFWSSLTHYPYQPNQISILTHLLLRCLDLASRVRHEDSPHLVAPRVRHKDVEALVLLASFSRAQPSPPASPTPSPAPHTPRPDLAISQRILPSHHHQHHLRLQPLRVSRSGLSGPSRFDVEWSVVALWISPTSSSSTALPSLLASPRPPRRRRRAHAPPSRPPPELHHLHRLPQPLHPRCILHALIWRSLNGSFPPTTTNITSASNPSEPPGHGSSALEVLLLQLGTPRSLLHNPHLLHPFFPRPLQRRQTPATSGPAPLGVAPLYYRHWIIALSAPSLFSLSLIRDRPHPQPPSSSPSLSSALQRRQTPTTSGPTPTGTAPPSPDLLYSPPLTYAYPSSSSHLRYVLHQSSTLKSPPKPPANPHDASYATPRPDVVGSCPSS